MWGGVAGIVIAIFAIVILYLTRSNIIDLLDRDVVMYDKNYQVKKESLQEAFNCLDLVAQNGLDIKNNPQYAQRAREVYNGLLCSVNNPKLYQDFYRMAIDVATSGYTVEEIEKFKIACRAELVSKRKVKAEGFKGTPNGNLNGDVVQNHITSILQPAQPAQPQPAQRPVQPAQPQRPAQQRPAQPAQRPQPRPQAPSVPQIDEDEE